MLFGSVVHRASKPTFMAQQGGGKKRAKYESYTIANKLWTFDYKASNPRLKASELGEALAAEVNTGVDARLPRRPVSASTVNGWLKKEIQLRAQHAAQVEKNTGDKQRQRAPQNPQMEEAPHIWFRQMQARDAPRMQISRKLPCAECVFLHWQHQICLSMGMCGCLRACKRICNAVVRTCRLARCSVQSGHV